LNSFDNDGLELMKLRNELLKKHQISMDRVTIPDDFVRCCFGELSPVCAIVGGIVAQEIIKAVSHKDQPLNNYFFYSGLEYSGLVAKLPPDLF